jgi:hypothetical protein
MPNAKSQYVRCRYGLVLRAQEGQIGKYRRRSPVPATKLVKGKYRKWTHEIRHYAPFLRPGSRSAQADRDRQLGRGRAGWRIFIELINGPMLFELKATPAEYKTGLDYAIAKGWLDLDRSGTFVKFTQVGAELFA